MRLSPIDLIPDFIPVSGLLDDLTVVLWVYQTLKDEIDVNLPGLNAKVVG